MIAALALALAAATAPAEAGGWLVPPLRLDVVSSTSISPRTSTSPRTPTSTSPRTPTSTSTSTRTPTSTWTSTAVRRRKSPALALGLSLALELPTLFIGPSLGHLYAGDWQHFAITGGARVMDVFLLVLLEKFTPGFGIGPLVAILNPEHLGASFTGYPVGFPVDLVLVLALVGSGIYDLVDAWMAAQRFNLRFGLVPPPVPAPVAAALAGPSRS
jgi:hypothetical protein